MIFGNRNDAARLLAERLGKFRNEHPLILAIPRGAVPMSKLIASELGGELDVVLVRKVRAPGNPEFAIGAVSEFGDTYLSPASEAYGISDAYVKETVEQELRTIRKRRAAYTPIRKPLPLKGRTVIIVDDGVATGATMLSAVRLARAQKAAKIVVAAPVASEEAADLLDKEADETVFLDVPQEFWAISQFYEDFPQVTDEEVSEVLRSASKAAA